MKKIFKLLFILFISLNSFSQNTDEELINKEIDEFNKVFKEINVNPTNALELVQSYQNNVKTKKGKAFSNLLFGQYYYKTDMSNKVDSCFYEAIKIFKEIKDDKGVMISNLNLAVMQQMRGDFNSAVETFNKSLPLLEKISDTIGIASTHQNLGGIFKTIKNYDKAEYHFKKAVKGYNSANYKIGEGDALMKLGELKSVTNQYKEAKKYYTKSMLIFKDINDTIGIANVMIFEADILLNVNNNAVDALAEYQIANNYLTGLNANCEATFAKEGIADCHFKLKNYTKAKQYYEIAIAKARDCEYNYALPSMIEDLIKTEEKLGNYKTAFTLQNQQKVFNDSIYRVEKIKAIQDIETKYQTAEKDKQLLANEIQLLTKTNLLEKQNKQFWIITSILIGTLLLLALAYYFYKKQSKLNKQLAELNKFKSQIFTIIGHDLRSPIASIAMSAENQATKTKTDTALNILDDLLTWGKANEQTLSTQNEIIYFETILDELTDEFAKDIDSKKLNITQQFENCKPINANKNEIITIVRNLLTNAIKFNSTNGTIKISCSAGQFLIENTFSNTIESGTQIGLGIVESLSKKNNCTFEFTKKDMATAKLNFND